MVRCASPSAVGRAWLVGMLACSLAHAGGHRTVIEQQIHPKMLRARTQRPNMCKFIISSLRHEQALPRQCAPAPASGRPHRWSPRDESP